jgi:TolB-like protein/DNA-binding winged helix-turn-helix (wHTH) protein/Tfp pilus assembly protein PilF
VEKRRFYEFGPFRIDPEERLLFREGVALRLAPKVVETLLVLMAHPGRIVEKDELMKAVWGPDTFVEEGGLARNIAVLRKALGEGPDDSRYIETIPKRGYRFIASLQAVSDPPSEEFRVEPDPVPVPPPPPFGRPRAVAVGFGALAAALLAVIVWPPGPTPDGPPHSLVVLALDNISQDVSQDYFADGMTDAIRTNLTQISALKVKSYPAEKRPGESAADIARRLTVDAALEGSVVTSGGRVRIAVLLTRAGTGEHLWSRNYERDLRDILALQSEVAQAIAAEIRVQVTPREQVALARSRSVDPEAYQAYLRGRHAWNRRTGAGLQTGIGYFQQAIQKDPSYALAYSGLADAFALAGSAPYDAMPPVKAMTEAKKLASRAIQLDDRLAEAHTSLAYVLLSYDWNLPAAEKEFRRALELNPGYPTAHHWYAHYLLAAGKLEEALTEVKRAQELEPLSQIIGAGVGWCYYHMGRHDEAIGQYEKVLEMDPNYFVAHFALGLAYGQKGLHQQATDALQKAVDLSGGSLLGARIVLGETRARAGDQTWARQILKEFHLLVKANQRYVPALYLAGLHASLGERKEALEWAAKAFQERNDYLVYIRTDPKFDALRNLPGFSDLMRRSGL